MPLTQASAISSFLDYLTFQKRYSAHTILAYQNDLLTFFDFLEIEYGDLQLAEIKSPFIKSWLAHLKEQGLESKSINRKISSLKSFFKYQLRLGLLQTSPMAIISSAKVKKRLPQFVAERDVDVLFKHVEFPDNFMGATDRLLCILLYNTGMRRAELLHLREADVDACNSNIKVLGKGNKERILPIGNDLIQQIQQYIAQKPVAARDTTERFLLVNEKGHPLYPKYVYNVVKKYLSLITTIDKKSPHIFRHSFATHLMNNGADINAVKELLGHSSLAATQIYTHNSIEKLKEIHKKAHPKA